MMGYIDQNKKIIFIHIPKTGGESIADYFFGKKLLFKQGKHHDIEHYLDTLGDDISQYYVFSIVRHPYKRMLSYYTYLKYTLKSIGNIELTEWLKNPIGENEYLYRPQYFWVNNTVKIFKFELGLSNIIKHIEKDLRIRYDKKLVHKNKTQINNISLSHEDKKLIFDRYYEDFIMFNYDK